MNGPTTLPTALETKSAFVEVVRIVCLVYKEEMFIDVITKGLSYGHSKSYIGQAQTTS